MAGRGRRLGGYGEKGSSLRRPGEVGAFSQYEAEISTRSLIKRINELSVTNLDPIALHETEILFRKLCTTGDSVRDVLMNLHCKALSDSLFGEKLLLILEQVASLEIDNVCVRSELLNFIENDFKMRDTLFQSDTQKFLNAVMFHGRVYNVIKIQGVPIRILGAALLEYMDLLLNGCDNQLRVLVIQILLNGNNILKTASLVEKYESLKYSLRKTLVEKNINRSSKFYVLLALDYMANNLEPLSGIIRNFYLENMDEDFLYLESLVKNSVFSKNPEIELTKEFMMNRNTSNDMNDKSNENEDIFKEIKDLNINQDFGKGFLLEVHNKTSDSFKNESTKFALRNTNYEDRRAKNKINDSKKSSSFTENQVDNNDDENEEFYGIQLKSNKISTRKLTNKNLKEKDYSENEGKFQSEFKAEPLEEIKTKEVEWN